MIEYSEYKQKKMLGKSNQIISLDIRYYVIIVSNKYILYIEGFGYIVHVIYQIIIGIISN